MKSIAVIPLCIVALGLSGCGDSKKPSKANFKAAINQWVETQPHCISIPRSGLSPAEPSDEAFPRYIDATPVTSELAQSNRQREQAPFDALVDAGLMVMTETTIEVRASFFGDQTKAVQVRAYDLSDDGLKAVVSKGEKTAFSTPSQQLCYGTPTVDEVVQFTEPADMMGMKLSQVNYRYHLKGLAGWAKNAGMQEAFAQLKRDAADSLEGKAVLVLTNDGWVHEKAARL